MQYVLDFIAPSMRCPSGGISGWIAQTIMSKLNRESAAEGIKRLSLSSEDEVFVELGAGNGAGLAAIQNQQNASLAENINNNNKSDMALLKVPQRIVCVEISPDFRTQLETLRETLSFRDRVEIHPNDAKDMTSFLDDASVDKMFALNVVYFLHPLDEYLREFHRVLKQGGVLSLGCKFANVPKNSDIFVNTDEAVIVAGLDKIGFRVNSSYVDLGPGYSFTEILATK